MLKNLTLAEWLAFFRIITFPLMVVLVFVLDKNVYAWVYLILFSTDAWDGFFAYVMKNDSDRREYLDTWGDNLYFLAGMVGFYHYEPAFFEEYIGFILFVVGLYALELVLSFLKFHKPSNFHNFAAKAAAFSQFIFLAYLFFFEANLILFYLAVFFSVLDVIDELIILYKVKEWRTHVKGFWDA